MSDSSSHPLEMLQALVDGRLEVEARATLDAHVDGCDACRKELAELRRAKEEVGGMETPVIPPGLVARVRGALDAEDAGVGLRGRLPIWLPLAAVAALIALVLVVPLAWRGGTDPGEAVRAAVSTAVAERPPMEAEGLSPTDLEAWFAARGIRFPTRVFDLGGMDLELVGGRVPTVAGERSALWTYRRPDGNLVLCQMYEGSVPPVGRDSEVNHRDDGVEFRTFRRGRVVLVFWQEGNVACVLAAEGLAPEELLSLAYAKAVRV
jgi:anti-sigma factor RsiW